MLNAEKPTDLQQDGMTTIKSSLPNQSLRTACGEELDAECYSFESWSRAMTLGSFASAWRMNDCCGSHWPSAHRLWTGQSLQGANVVVHAKHGLGDAVQMLQYARQLRDLSVNLRYEVPVSLRALLPYFQGVGSESTTTPSSPELYPVRSVECEMMELPYLFRTRFEDLPLAIDYLAIPESISTRYLSCMGATRKPRIGIVWAGGEWDCDRWVPLSLLSPLIANHTCEWWNLQGGLAASETYGVRLTRICRSSEEGLVALVATMSNLDLIITVDTLAAHLSAALGKPTWLMLKHDADWRWLSKRDDSPWYPSMRLFRQSSRGDWSGVVAAVGQALRNAEHVRKS